MVQHQASVICFFADAAALARASPVACGWAPPPAAAWQLFGSLLPAGVGSIMDYAKALRLMRYSDMESLEADYETAARSDEYKHATFFNSVGVGLYFYPGVGTDYWHKPRHKLTCEELLSFKLPPLTDAAEDTDVAAFRTRGAQLLAEWMRDHFQTQMCTPEGRRDPLYTLAHSEAVYCHTNQSITVPLEPCAARVGKYCDGHARASAEDECSLWHATRDAYIGLICREGIKSSCRSHGASGRKTTTQTQKTP